MDTSLILLNAGVFYMFLLANSGIFMIYISLGYFRNEFFLKLKHIWNFLFFNAFLRLWIQSSLEVTLAAILEIFEGGINGNYEIFDYTLSILTMVRDI